MGTSLAAVREVGRADGNPWEQRDEAAGTAPAMTSAGRREFPFAEILNLVSR